MRQVHGVPKGGVGVDVGEEGGECNGGDKGDGGGMGLEDVKADAHTTHTIHTCSNPHIYQTNAASRSSRRIPSVKLKYYHTISC